MKPHAGYTSFLPLLLVLGLSGRDVIALDFKVYRRVETYLSQNCEAVSQLLPQVCQYSFWVPVSSPACCSMFSLVDACSGSTCDGTYDANLKKSLETLVNDQSFCSKVSDVGKYYCRGDSKSNSCVALKCLMNIVCFNGLTKCDQPPPDPEPHAEPETHANNVHRRSRTFALAESSACQSTNLVGFDVKNIQVCPVTTLTKQCGPDTQTYRSFDGRCNNIGKPDWGRSFQPPKRLVANRYNDRLSQPRIFGRDGSPLESVRTISREVCTDTENLAKELTVLHMAFGQYIDHDITGFPVIKFNDTTTKCCNPHLSEFMYAKNGGPCFPITISQNDDFYHQRCMEFIRSSPALDENDVELSPREQINSLSAYIDASTVYGSTDTFTNEFKLSDGTLKVSPGDFLPKSGTKNCKIQDENRDYCQAAGDARVNVFIGLGMFHTVFHRMHNNILTRLRHLTGDRWQKETYFQETRKIVAAVHQVVTYKEYLPSFLSPMTMHEYGLTVPTKDAFNRNVYRYNPTTNPQMSNAFSTAAFRYGHSQIQRSVQVGTHISVPMEDTLMRPHLLLKHGVEKVIVGMTMEKAETVDGLFVTSVTDRLFENNSTKRDGLDLVALNTQRGRDHGLAPYNDYREFCGLGRVDSFDHPDISSMNTLKKVYKHVDDIDLFIGGVVEKPLKGSKVGPTFACILAQQFRDLKYGDRFWHETDSQPEGFTDAQLNEIRKMTISGVLCDNSDLKEIQENALFISDVTTNPIKNCGAHPKIDLRHWA